MWHSSKSPPLFTTEYPWHISEVVYVITKSGSRHLATFEKIDDESEPQWFSHCSERWSLKEVMAWHVLPEISCLEQDLLFSN